MTKELLKKVLMKPFSAALLISSLTIAIPSNAQTMADLGSAGFSSGAAGNISMDIDASNTPYVAYTDSAMATN